MYFGDYPCTVLENNIRSCVFVAIWIVSTYTSMYMNYYDQKQNTKESLGKGSSDNVNMFYVLKGISPWTVVINLRSCGLKPHKLW